MADAEVKTVITVEGGQQAKTMFDQLAASFGGLGKAAQGLVTNFGQVSAGLSAMMANFQQGNVVQGFAGAMQAVSSAVSVLTNPISLVAEGIAVFARQSEHLSNEAVALFRHLQQLQAVSGETARGIEAISHAFELAGVSSDSLNMAMFRLGMEIERGGKTLRRFGVETTDAMGNMKSEGTVLLDVRNKLSEIGDASTRNAVLMQIFGRAGRSLAPIMAMNSDEFARYVALAQDSTASSERFMIATRHLVTEQAELSHQWEKLKIQLAETIALPVMTWISNVASHWVSGMNRMYEASRWLFGGKSPISADAEAALKKTSENLGKTGGRGILTQEAAKEREQVLRDDYDLAERRLRAQAQFNEMLEKMQTGSEVHGIEQRRRANDELIKMENQKFNELMDVERRKGTSGLVDPAIEEKFRKERNVKIQALEDESRKLVIQSRLAEVSETKKIMDAELKIRHDMISSYIGAVKDQAKQEVAVLEASGSTRIDVARNVFEIELDVAKRTSAQKIAAIDNEIRKQQELKAQFPDVFQVQFEANQKLIELGLKRVAAEREQNDEIFNARKQLYDKLVALAKSEASAGESLEAKALASLQKRGRKYASEGDIISEIEDMRSKALSSLGGGRFKIEDRQMARGLAGPFGQLAQTGSSPSSAIGLLNEMNRSALMGQNKAFAPTGMTLPGLSASVRVQESMLSELQQIKQILAGGAIGSAPGASAPGDASAGAPAPDTQLNPRTGEMETVSDSVYRQIYDRLNRDLQFEQSGR